MRPWLWVGRASHSRLLWLTSSGLVPALPATHSPELTSLFHLRDICGKNPIIWSRDYQSQNVAYIRWKQVYSQFGHILTYLTWLLLLLSTSLLVCWAQLSIKYDVYNHSTMIPPKSIPGNIESNCTMALKPMLYGATSWKQLVECNKLLRIS